MKNYIFIILLAAFFSLLISLPSECPAVDKGGCLTCHGYPGLVKHTKPGTFKVLHIDGAKHLASSHGMTDCRQCHPKTVQIPHTGVTEVDCTTRCHLEERKKINALDPSYFVSFHKNERFAITRLDDGTSCRVCHPLYPHSSNNKVRALLNMHTGFLLCEVCHLRKEHFDKLTYDWKEHEDFEFTGEPYGTHRKQEIEEPEESKDIVSRLLNIFSEDEDGKKDGTKKTKYQIARIAVFRANEKGSSLFINTTDNDRAGEYLKKEKKLSPKEKKEKLDYFHREIAKKEISVACDECHSPKGILDFRKLGFSEKKTNDLQYLNIKGLVTKYETFYLPNLFGH